jgi:hypothetical protein
MEWGKRERASKNGRKRVYRTGWRCDVIQVWGVIYYFNFFSMQKFIFPIIIIGLTSCTMDSDISQKEIEANT